MAVLQWFVQHWHRWNLHKIRIISGQTWSSAPCSLYPCWWLQCKAWMTPLRVQDGWGGCTNVKEVHSKFCIVTCMCRFITCQCWEKKESKGNALPILILSQCNKKEEPWCTDAKCTIKNKLEQCVYFHAAVFMSLVEMQTWNLSLASLRAE